MREPTRRSVLLGCLFLALAPACAPDGGAGDVAAAPAALRAPGAECDEVVSVVRHVDVGDGVTLRVVEKWSGRSLARREHRALLMLTATLVDSRQYDTSVPGDESFDAMARAARAGYFVFSADYEGYGGSTLPADGRSVTAERLLGEMGNLVEWIRRTHGVRDVDLFGSSLGSSLAIALGGTGSPIPRRHVGRIVLTSNVYADVTPLFASVFFSPETRALLESAPNGYVTTPPEAYGIILASADPAAAAWGFATFPGPYAVGPTLEGFDLPVFDAHLGRAPALQVWGDADLITPRSDVDHFQADYGGPVELLVLHGGGHAPTLEPVRDEMWEGVFAFLDVDASEPCGRCGHP